MGARGENVHDARTATSLCCRLRDRCAQLHMEKKICKNEMKHRDNNGNEKRARERETEKERRRAGEKTSLVELSARSLALDQIGTREESENHL